MTILKIYSVTIRNNNTFFNILYFLHLNDYFSHNSIKLITLYTITKEYINTTMKPPISSKINYTYLNNS